MNGWIILIVLIVIVATAMYIMKKRRNNTYNPSTPMQNTYSSNSGLLSRAKDKLNNLACCLKQGGTA